MRYVTFLILARVLLVLFCIPSESEGAVQSDVAPGLRAASAVNNFAIDVYKQLASKEGNIFYSSYGISSLIAMTYAGARGNTAAEMAKITHFANYKSEIHSAMKHIQDEINSVPEEEGVFIVANRIWLDTREDIVSDYSAFIEEYYGTGAESADFFNDYEKSRLVINNWIAEKTRDKVKDALKPGEVNSITKLIPVNSVYFYSNWLEPFDKLETIEEPFRVEREKERKVSMLRRTGNFLYGENEVIQWIRVPYRIQGFYLTIFLPRENDSFTQLKEFERKLSYKAINEWITEAQMRRVALIMPKFKERSRINLLETLRELGMNLAFDWMKADFSGMVKEPKTNGFSLCISDIIHQAFIEIDEEKADTSAAAAVLPTEAVIESDSIFVFRADRPFVYCITDKNGVILLMGRMTDPR